MHSYDYFLPPELIAKQPSSPRDAARLLVYQKSEDKVICDKFLNLPEYLPEAAVLVFNQSKVLPAKLVGRKESGGQVELLFIKAHRHLIECLANSALAPGQRVFLSNTKFLTVEKKEENRYFLRPGFSLAQMFWRYGRMPIPPYIKHSPLTERDLRQKYQTIFAKRPGSIAAPTASLHFTRRLMNKLRRSAFDLKFVTLHVGLGTFAPLRQDNWQKQELHQEEYQIDFRTAEFLNRAKVSGRPIIAVGTTVVRTLESAADKNGRLTKLSGQTKLFITENYKLKFVHGLITNFHLPRSSLLMLVSAFVPRQKLLNLYALAIRQKFRFFSFGDGMLIY